MQMCASIDGPLAMEVVSASDPSTTYLLTGLFDERTYPGCSCPAYTYAKRTVQFGSLWMPEVCKHIRRAQTGVCGWHEQYGETQTPDEQRARICPRCGGSTVNVRVGV